MDLESDGSFSYVPPPDFTGRVAFRYGVRDGKGGQGTGLVQINITPVNDVPSPNDDFGGIYTTEMATLYPRANDLDIDSVLDPRSVPLAPGHGATKVDVDTAVSYMLVFTLKE